MTQSDFASKSLPIWHLFCRIERVWSNSNYILGKVGRNYTYYVHRICLRPMTLQGRIDLLNVIQFENVQRDTSLVRFRGEPTLFDESVPSLLDFPTTGVTKRNVVEDPPPVTLSLRFVVAPTPVQVLAAPDTADNQVADPQASERSSLPVLKPKVRFTTDYMSQTDEVPKFIRRDSSDSSADTTFDNSF